MDRKIKLYGLPRLKTFDLIDSIPSVRQWLITSLEKYKAGNGQEDKVLTDISATFWVIWTNKNV